MHRRNEEPCDICSIRQDRYDRTTPVRTRSREGNRTDRRGVWRYRKIATCNQSGSSQVNQISLRILFESQTWFSDSRTEVDFERLHTSAFPNDRLQPKDFHRPLGAFPKMEPIKHRYQCETLSLDMQLIKISTAVFTSWEIRNNRR